MKKLVLALILILFISNVLALEKTRIFGYVDDINSNIILTPDYKANGIQYIQSITKSPNKTGNWEYVLYSDPGKIKLTATLGGVSREYEIPVGSEFKIDFANDANSGVQNANQNLTQNQTQSIQNTTSENQEVANITQESNKTGITGKSILEGVKGVFTKKVFIITGIIIVFLVVIVFGIRIYNKRGLPSFKIIPFKQKFPGDREIEKAEEKLGEVQAEIDTIKNRERRIQEVSGKLKAAEKELEKLKGIK